MFTNVYSYSICYNYIMKKPRKKESIPHNVVTINDSQVHFGEGNNTVKNESPEKETSFSKQIVITVIGGVLVLIIGSFLLPKNTINKIDFEKEDIVREVVDNKSNIQETVHELRSLYPLETGKEISELPNNTYFYADPMSVKYEIDDPKKDFLSATNKQLKNYSFEIQKKNSRYYLIGFVSDEFYSTLGSIDVESKHGILYPQKLEQAKNPIGIPFDKIYTLRYRNINLDEKTVVSIFDIGFKEVQNIAISHNS